MNLRDELISTLRQFTISDVLLFERKYDEQFHALKYLSTKIMIAKKFFELSVMNALISYQLNCTGERYWWEFARYFTMNNSVSDSLSAMKNFLEKSACNVRLKNQKIVRLEKVFPVITKYSDRVDWLVNNQIVLPKKLARALNTKISAKTIAFSSKIMNYALRIIKKKDFPAPNEIPIPLDSRIQKISEKLGADDPISFWFYVSKITKIPPLHIDSLLWVGYKLVKEKVFDVYDKKVEKLLLLLSKIMNP